MSKKHNKTNVILIMSDDLGYEVLGCNGGTSYETPVLDKLATEVPPNFITTIFIDLISLSII